MKVILQKNVQKLGKLGDVVESKPGYFRNFLEPRGLAVIATEGALKKREEDLEALKAKADKMHQEAIAVAEKITALGNVKLTARAGDGGKLYGKITNKDIAEAIAKGIGAEVDKKGIKVLEDIGTLGTYKTYVKVATDVQAEINVIVYDETQGEYKEPKEPAAPAPAAQEPAEEEAVEA
ncbi:MAG: 50S ribosomal protein L9 [Candidatus Obscuribacterales bacterium]|jgi:large subunit ribosomal protein L9|nr:50S ribosomal protein L9 [Candidatus Obscuribacterales bacterium]